jgi:outer membrane protein
MRKLSLFFFLAGMAAAQVPEIKTYDGQGRFSSVLKRYLPAYEPQTNYANSNRLDALMRAGNIYLSLQDAIALALENNLDIEYHRYDRRQAETDQLRASAGQLLRFQSSTIRAGFSSASSGVLGGVNALGGGSGSGTTGQSSILSGFTIQAAGSNIPNLEPLAFASWQSTHQTRPLTASATTGTNYLVSSARAFVYGVQKSFLSGTQVTLDWSQQSLFQNAPLNDFNPSVTGNAALNIRQPLLQGFGWATNKRAITISRNNLTVADLNFKEQVMATVKNVIDLYWDLVTFIDNLKSKEKALELAQRLHSDNKKRIAAGAIAPIDLIQAEAGVQTAELDMRGAKTQVLQQEMIVKSALTRAGVDSAAVIDAHIIPVDRIELTNADEVQPIQDMIAYALENRPELQESKITLENSRINMKGVKNAMLPGLDVFVDLQNNALAGQVNTIPIPTGEAFTGVTRAPANPYFLGGYGAILAQVFGRNFPNYSVGFNLNVPLRNSAARADMVKNELDYRQAQIQERQQQNTIRLNVVNARIALEQAREAYNSAQKARQLQEQNFAGEQRKYQLGTSTFLNVVLVQRDVVTAQANEITALNLYIKAKTNMDIVLGRILEVNHVDIEEAYKGRVKRAPGPLPVLDPAAKSAEPGKTGATAGYLLK